MTSVLAISWLLMGCGGSSGGLSDCLTAMCRQELVVEAWTEDKERVVSLLSDLPSAVEREATVVRLVDLYPAEVSALCELLPSGPGRRRCEEVGRRPHLHMDKPMITSPDDVSSHSPTERRLIRLLRRDSPLAEVEADPGGCALGTDQITCLTTDARVLAGEGAVYRAAARCQAVPVPDSGPARWRSECFFAAAEHRIKEGRAEGYADAVDMCTAAELYGPFCLAHLLRQMAQDAPPADELSGGRWEVMAGNDAAIRAVWKGRPMEELMVAQLWAVGLAVSVGRARKVSGDALNQIPLSATPHLRAAIAARLLSDADPGKHSLAEWVGRVQAAMEKRSRREVSAPKMLILPEIKDAWPRFLAGPEGYALIAYRGRARRVHVDTPEVDAAICVIEAAARLDPPHEPLLREGLEHSHPAVRSTATWILKLSELRQPTEPEAEAEAEAEPEAEAEAEPEAEPELSR